MFPEHIVLLLCAAVTVTNCLNLNTLSTRSPIYIAKTVDGQYCAIPFMYNGRTYHDCITEASDKPWCSLDKHFVSGQSKWGYCAPHPKEYEGCELATPNVTLAEVEEILREHNTLRAGLPSLRMKKMEWNSELAMKAQMAANRCSYDHVDSQLCADRYETGQNLYYSFYEQTYPSNMPWKDVIEHWSAEVKNFDISTLNCAANKLCGHYTQVVWDKSGQIGCGKGFCHGNMRGNMVYAIQYFCNYFDSGNYINTPPYQVSEKERCKECHMFDPSRKFRCTKDQLCEACQNDQEGCQGMDDIKQLAMQGKICADTMSTCEDNKQLCAVPMGPWLPPPLVELIHNCNKTCNRC